LADCDIRLFQILYILGSNKRSFVKYNVIPVLLIKDMFLATDRSMLREMTFSNCYIDISSLSIFSYVTYKFEMARKEVVFVKQCRMFIFSINCFTAFEFLSRFILLHSLKKLLFMQTNLENVILFSHLTKIQKFLLHKIPRA